jgi:disulfide bond formation protein DsbB
VNNRSESLIFMSWVVAVFATAGSLFFSEVMEYPPCSLCWYQRIAMYPLVIILWIGSKQAGRITFSFAMPFALVGWITAIYHNLLQYDIIPEGASPCRQGVPCSINYIEWLGFITIPLLSFVAFSMISGILLFLKRKNFYE